MPYLKVRVNLLSSRACLPCAVPVCSSLFHSLLSQSMSSSSNKTLHVYASRRLLLLFLLISHEREKKKYKRVWKILFFNRDFCFRSETRVIPLLGNLPWFISASLTWTPLIFNKQMCNNIPNTMSYLLSWFLGHHGLPGMPAPMLIMHSIPTCWRSSICWVSAT